MHPNSQHHLNQRPVVASPYSQMSVQSNAISHFNNNPPTQQLNTNFQQQTQLHSSSGVIKHQISNIQQPYNIPSGLTRITSPISNQQSSGTNQTPQFPIFGQLPPNSQHQPNQRSMLTPTSQTPHQANINSNFNNLSSSHQENRSFQHHHQSSAVHHQTSNTQQPYTIPAGLTSVPSAIPNQHIQHQQNNNGSCRPNQTSQFPTFNQLPPNSQNQSDPRPVLTPISQIPHQANVITQYINTPLSQQENKNFQQQAPQCHQSSADNQQISNTQQLYNVPFVSTSISSNQQMKCQQNNQQSGVNKTPQFSTFNQLHPNSQHHLNQRPVVASPNSQMSVESNVISHFNNPPTQQLNTNLQQTQLHYSSGVIKHQISNIQQPYNIPSGLTGITSPISNQQIKCQQSSGSNQTLQFPVCSQLPPNSQHQPNQRSMLTPTSQPSHQTNINSHFNNLPSSHQENRSFQQHHQSSPVHHQTSNTQQPYNIPAGLTSVPSPIPNQHIQHQQSNNGSCRPNQTSQFPTFNQLPPNSQNQSDQRPVLTPISQIPHQTNVISQYINTPPSQQENKNFQQQTQLHHQSNAVNPVLTCPSKMSHQSTVTSHFNNNPSNQQENINLQQTQMLHQSNVVNPQTGNIQLTYNIPSRSTSIQSPICNQYSHSQQSSTLCELSSQIPQFTAFNQLPSNFQQEPHQKPVLSSSNSQNSAPEPPIQSNLNSPAVPQFGPPSNFTSSFPPIMCTQHNFGNFQTLGNVPETNNDINIKCQSEVDSEWVSQWLVARRKEKITAETKRSAVVIPEVRRLLHQALAYLKVLSYVRDNLKSCMNEGSAIWEHKIKQAMNVKCRLNAIMEKLLQPGATLHLISKLKKIKKKRVLHRRQREKRKMQRLEQQKKRLEIHRLLDSYMETEKEKVLQVKREEEMKKEADNILSEVRRKLQEGKRAQERLRTMEKLRQARKDTAQKRGLHIVEEADDQFSKKISFLKAIVHRQLIDYDAEEKALRVMLETEQEGQREQEETYRKERRNKLLKKMQKRIKECLLGNGDSLDGSDPLWYFRQYYTQAENNLDALVQTRRQWDIYLVRPTDACGSSIPVCWITPDPPSSHSWASAIDLKDCE